MLKKAAIDLGEGKLDTRVTDIPNGEMQSLAVAVNNMVIKLENSTVSKNYLSNIINSMRDSVIVINKQSRIKIINPASTAILDYEEHELIEQSITKLNFNISNHLTALYNIKESNTSNSIKNEIYYISKNKNKIPMLFSASLVKNAAGHVEGIVCVAKDLSEIKQKEQELRSANKKLNSKNKELLQLQSQLVQSAKLASVGEMATGIAHELNQPLGIISMYTDLRLKEVRKGQHEKTEATYELISK